MNDNLGMTIYSLGMYIYFIFIMWIIFYMVRYKFKD